MGCNVRLDDELNRNAFIFAQSGEPVEDLFPGRVSGEVVVSEEVEIDAGVPGMPVELSPLCTRGTGSGLVRPWTLIMVQNEQLKGQPRLQSRVP